MDKPIKLPLDLEQLKTEIENDGLSVDLHALEQLNLQFTELKRALKQNEKEKSAAAKQLSKAKKAEKPTDEFKAQLNTLSAQIKEQKKQLNQLNASANDLLAPSNEPLVALHFQPYACKTVDANYTIEMVDAGYQSAWNEFVDRHPGCSVYHRYEFRSIIERAFGHHCVYLAATTEQGECLGVLPATQLNSKLFGNYLVSVPFFNYGGAIAVNESIEQALQNALQEKAVQLEAEHVEYRDTKPRAGMPQKTDKNALVLALPNSADTLWEDIGTKVRAQIKKADEHNLSFHTGKHELLDDYYKVFAQNMRDLGTPVYSKSFFKEILDHEQIQSTLIVVKKNQTPVSCAFLIHYKDTMEIPWASTIQAANQYNANMFMYWHILRYAINQKAAFFDFGRSSVDAGTFKFKLQWGAKPVPLIWNYWLKDREELPELNPNNPKYKLAISLWQKMPVWLTKLIGPHLVKNLP